MHKALQINPGFAPAHAALADHYERAGLAVDSTDAATVYAGGLHGLVVSHDGAVTWTPSTAGLPQLDIYYTETYGIRAVRPKSDRGGAS